MGQGGDTEDYGGRGISGAWKGVGWGEEALSPEPSSGALTGPAGLNGPARADRPVPLSVYIECHTEGISSEI